MVPLVYIVLRWVDAAYLGLLVPAVPIGLGWIAAAQLALLDETQLRARHGRHMSCTLRSS